MERFFSLSLSFFPAILVFGKSAPQNSDKKLLKILSGKSQWQKVGFFIHVTDFRSAMFQI
jgi:hypothetical protein